MANTKFFVVVAMPHNGDRGPWPAPILVTGNGLRAVAVARCVETLGFRINWQEEGVYIFLMELEKIYERADFKAGAEWTNPLVYKRDFHINHRFVEYFWDAELANDCDMSLAGGDYFNPSKPLSPEPSPEAAI